MRTALLAGGLFAGVVVGSPSPPPGGGSPYDKLVYASGGLSGAPRKWLDTTAAGQDLDTVQDMLIGASYSVKLFTEGNWEQPAADALTLVGNKIRPGPGWGTVYPCAYILEIENTTTGLVTQMPVYVFSNKAADRTVSSNGALVTALGDAKTAVQTGAAFQGFVIDLVPGIDYGSIEFDLGFHAAQTKQVLLRNADPNRINPASRPKLQHCTIYNNRYWALQSLLFEIGNLQILSYIRTRTIAGSGNGTNIDRPLMLNNIFRGGQLVFNNDGSSFIDHTQSIDPTDQFHPSFSFFEGIRTYDDVTDTTTFTRADLFVGHTATKQTGAAYGVWAQATTPAYVGNNTPTGGAGVFGAPGSGHWFGGNWPADSRPAAPATFDLQWEVAYLDSTPRNTTYGGANRVKPAGGPDGNYIVAWKMEDTPGRTWPGQSAGNNGSLSWLNHRTFYYRGLPTAVLKVQGAEFNNMIFALNRGTELRNLVFSYQITGTDSSLWTFENYLELFARDGLGATWAAPAPYTDPHIWRVGRGHIHLFNFVGRALIREADFNNPHGDSDQHFDDSSYVGAGGKAQPYKLNVGNIQFTPVGSGRLGAGIQGPFLSDISPAAAGYRFVSCGNLIHANDNAWGVFRLQAENAIHNSVLEGFTSGADGVTTDPSYPPAVIHVNNTWGTLVPPLASELAFPARYYSNGNVVAGTVTPGVWSAPNFAFTDDVNVLKARFTGIGAAAGKGAFGNPDTVVDLVRKTWNPNAWEFRLLQEQINAQPANTAVPSAPRQLLFGSKPFPVSVANGQWSKGATRAAALAAPKTSDPGVLAPGEWIVLWATTGALPGALTTATLTVNGVASSMTVQTAEAFAYPAGNDLANITRTNYASSGTTTSWTPFTDVSVPDGAMALFISTSNSNGTTTLDSLDAGWTDVANTLNGTAIRFRIFSYFNNTGSAVLKSLRLTTGTARTFSGVLLIIPRTTAGLVLRTALSAAQTASGTTPTILPVTLPSARKAWFGALLGYRNTSQVTSASGAPALYAIQTNGQRSPAATTDTGTAVAERFNEVLTEDPTNFTMSYSGTSNVWITYTLAVYEDTP